MTQMSIISENENLTKPAISTKSKVKNHLGGVFIIQTRDSQLGLIFTLQGYSTLQEMHGKTFPHRNSGSRLLLAFNSYRLRMILSLLQ